MQSKIESAIMNTYNRYPVTIVSGKGCYVWDDQNNKYLDFTSGIATCNLGHAPDGVKQALVKQLDEIWHCSNLFHIPNQNTLGKLLVEHSCFDKVFFCNSGAEANEAAIKLARKYAYDHQKSKDIITFTQSFHGRTMATLTATGQTKIQTGFSPLIPGFSYLSFNDFTALNQIKELKPAAVLLEIVQGEGGVIPANPVWLKELAKICKTEHILLIVDEIQTGIGRTGKLFAYEHYGIEPDIMTLAKGLGSGFPIGAMLAKKEVAARFQPGSHGSTFGGNPLATAAGIATMNQIIQTDILSSAKEQMDQLKEKLLELKMRHTVIKEVRGLGFLLGVEIDGEANKIVQLAIEEKLLVLTAGPHVVRILPPLTVTSDDMKLFIERFDKVLEKME